ncbi:hypothetical protein ACI78R_01420 [Geodermatophilus sp. SYSU D01106]
MSATDHTHNPNAWMYLEGPARRVLRMKLLHRRDHLAAAAAEHAAHGQVGAELLWRAVDTAEAHLRDIFPETWAEEHEDWAATDAARLHTVDAPRPADCRLCALNPPARSSAAA